MEQEYNYIEGFKILQSFQGRRIKQGPKKNSFQNQYWLVENENKQQFYIMECIDWLENIKYIHFSLESIEKVRDYTWQYKKFGPQSSFSQKGYNCHRYMNMILCDNKYHDEREYTIYYIDGNKLNNRTENLLSLKMRDELENSKKISGSTDIQPIKTNENQPNANEQLKTNDVQSEPNEQIIKQPIKNNNQLYVRDKLYVDEQNKIVNELNKILHDDGTEYILPDDFGIIEHFQGHASATGARANIMLNPYWLINDTTNDVCHYMMRCSNENTYFIFSEESIDYVENKTWYICSNGYIATSGCGEEKMHYLHQLICKTEKGDESNSKSVDHINRIKTDNRIENLRWATQSEQNANTGKRARKHNARPLPDGITQDELPKYVVYYENYADKEKKQFRSFFQIDKCPGITKKLTSSKSSKLTNREKLDQIIKILEEHQKK